MNEVARVIVPDRLDARERSVVLAPNTDMTPQQMVSLAVSQNADPVKLKALMDLQERWEANEARKSFNEAFAAFKSEAVKIIKRTEVKDGPLKGKFHANLFDVVDATTPALSKHGLAISWRLSKDEPAWMEVTCTVRHVGGHSESVSMGGAPDTGPGRNAIQARGSTKSYLERYTATAILGLAAQDADNDGADDYERISETQAADLVALIQEVGANKLALLTYLKRESIGDIPAKDFKDIVALVEQKRTKVPR